MRRPDTFVVGVKKGGTSALHTFLAQHRQVFMSPLKEPNFFAPDLPFSVGHRPARNEEEYLALYRGSDGFDRLGESSTSYLLSEQAANAIAAFNPEAKIIVSLRDPVEVICSLHSYMVYLGIEPLESLDEALDAEDERRQGRRHFRRSMSMPHWLHYRRVVDYGPQLRRYLEAFDRQQIHLVRHEDLRDRTREVLRSLFRFLNVDEGQDIRVGRINSNRRARSKMLRNLMTEPTSPIYAATRTIVPRGARQRVFGAVFRANTRTVDRVPPESAVIEALRAELCSGVEDVERLLGWNLTAWKTG